MKTRRVHVWGWLALSLAGLVACSSNENVAGVGAPDSSADAPTGSDATVDGNDGAASDDRQPMGDATIDDAAGTSLDASDAASVTDSDAAFSDGVAPGADAGADASSVVDASSDIDAISGVDASIDAGGVDAGDSDAAPPLTLTMDAFEVPSNTEVIKCQQFGNPFGTDVDMVSMDGYVTPGVTAFFLDNMAPSTSKTSTAPLQDCASGLITYPFPYLSQQPGHFIVDYPAPTMGYRLAATHGLMFQVHVVNVDSQPISPTVSIAIRTANAGVVTTHVGTIVLQNTTISIPPNTMMASPLSFAATVAPVGGSAASYDYSIFTSWGSMGSWGVSMTASTNGTDFYAQSGWSQPPVMKHNPVVPMTGGQTITWTCKEYNTFPNTLTYGEYDVTNARCAYIGQYYPPVDLANPDIMSFSF